MLVPDLDGNWDAGLRLAAPSSYGSTHTLTARADMATLAALAARWRVTTTTTTHDSESGDDT